MARTDTTPANTTPATQPPATAAPAGRPLTVTFRRAMTLDEINAAHAAKKGGTVARCDIDGAFIDALPWVLHSVSLSLGADKKTLTVYMPGSGPRGFYKTVGPAMVAVPENIELFDASGARITETVDRAGALGMKRFEAALVNAWQAANATGQPYDRPIPLTLNPTA